MLNPELIVTGGSILSSILSIVVSVTQLAQRKSIDINDAIEEYYAATNDSEKKILKDENNRNTVKTLCLLTISPVLLEQLSDEAKNCEREYVQNRQRANGDPVKLQSVEDKACSSMCRILKTIMRHNDHELPDEDKNLKKWFVSYRCDRF